MTYNGPLPLVGVPADVREVGIHPHHAVGEKYINAIAHASGVFPVSIPAFGEGRDLAPLEGRFSLGSIIERLDGLFLTGSPSNVMPQRYDGPDSLPGTMHDEQRDCLTLPLICAAVDAGLPLFAVCRGIQELNVAFGGTLHQRIQEVPGMLDHRADKDKPRDEQFAPAHGIALAEGGLLAGLAGRREVMVNSVHSQGIDRLADGLVAEAWAPDGLGEAVRVAKASAFALAVQWHPEWRVHENPFSMALFEAFGDALRARAAARGPPERVAEPPFP